MPYLFCLFKNSENQILKNIFFLVKSLYSIESTKILFADRKLLEH